MEIRIDTKHDSKEEIKKVIELLNHIVGQEPREQPGAFQPASIQSVTNVPPAIPPVVPAIQASPAIPTIQAPITNTPPVQSEPIDLQVEPGLFNLFDDTKPSVAAPPTPVSPITPSVTPIDDITKTVNHKASVTELFKDPLKIVFGKNDPELEEVQRLKAKSATKSEDLRIIAYK